MSAEVIDFFSAKEELVKAKTKRRVVGIKYDPSKNSVEIIYENEEE